jgi:hypothetical protein
MQPQTEFRYPLYIRRLLCATCWIPASNPLGMLAVYATHTRSLYGGRNRSNAPLYEPYYVYATHLLGMHSITPHHMKRTHCIATMA